MDTPQQVLVKKSAKKFLISQALFGIGMVVMIIAIPTGSVGLIPLGTLFIFLSLPYVVKAKRLQAKAHMAGQQ